jgi:hypothetical protein
MTRDQLRYFVRDQSAATAAAIRDPEVGSLISLSVVAGLVSSLALMRAGDKLSGVDLDKKKALRVALTATLSGLAFVVYEVYSAKPRERA